MNHILYFFLSSSIIFFGSKYFQNYSKYKNDIKIEKDINNDNNNNNIHNTSKIIRNIAYNYSSSIYIPNNQNCQSLGRHTWALLHSTAATFPIDPTEEDIKYYKDFFYGLLYHYPSHSKKVNEFVKKKPLQLSERNELIYYICELHNYVNSFLAKGTFNCKKAFDVWGGECGCDD